MSRGYTTPQDRSRRRRAAVIVVVGVVVVVGWITAVVALAGSGGGSRQGGAEGAASGSSGQQQQQPASANASPEDTAEDKGQGGQGEQSSADQGGQSDLSGDRSAGGQPPVDQNAQTGEAVAGEAQTGDVFGPLEEEGQSQGSSTESGEAAQADTSETELTRARAASESYISAAYGYNGESEDDYLEGIEQAAAEEIHDSPGGSMLKGYSRAAPECGMKSQAILEEFEVIGRSAEGLDASVTFAVEDADGVRHTFRQDQRLSSSGGSYEVSAVSMEELISETTPKESCPGAQSSDASSSNASSEGGQDEIKPDELGIAEEDQLRSAADRYITSAYGYTGESGEEYRQRVNRTVDEQSFYSSPGGEQVREYARAATADGITAAAVMESFEITSKDGTKVEGTAYFRVGSSYDRYGELEGEGEPFAIDLTLTPLNSAYEVGEASLERERSGGQTPDSQAKKTS